MVAAADFMFSARIEETAVGIGRRIVDGKPRCRIFFKICVRNFLRCNLIYRIDRFGNFIAVRNDVVFMRIKGGHTGHILRDEEQAHIVLVVLTVGVPHRTRHLPYTHHAAVVLCDKRDTLAGITRVFGFFSLIGIAHGRNVCILMGRNEGFANQIRFIGCFSGSVFCTGIRTIPCKEIRLVGRLREGICILIKCDKLSGGAVKQNKLIFAGRRIAVQTQVVVIIRNRGIGHAACAEFHQAAVLFADLHSPGAGHPFTGFLDRSRPAFFPNIIASRLPRIFDVFEFRTSQNARFGGFCREIQIHDQRIGTGLGIRGSCYLQRRIVAACH